LALAGRLFKRHTSILPDLTQSDLKMSSSDSPTLRQKIGQLLIVGFRGFRPEDCDLIVRDIRAHHIGGIVLFDQEMADRTVDRRNVESPAQLRDLIGHLQAQAAIPLLVSIDQEGGRVNRLKAQYGFPESISHQELGKLDQPEETHRHAAQTARTLVDLGINLNLAPVVDLDANPDNPIIQGKGRSFSSEPDKVIEHAGEFIKAHREHKVLTCAKHFPGHGSASGDTHLGLVDVTNTWNDRELAPFRRLIELDLCDMIMSAHVFNSKLDAEHPATLSKAVITDLLRGKLGYDGVVCSDDLEMKAIADHYRLENSVPMAIGAGIDMLCFGNNLSYDPDIAPKAVEVLAKAVESGRIPESRIDESHRRVMALKRKADLIAS
jgi:beta-N-acetylhexosaminidase